MNTIGIEILDPKIGRESRLGELPFIARAYTIGADKELMSLKWQIPTYLYVLTNGLHIATPVEGTRLWRPSSPRGIHNPLVVGGDFEDISLDSAQKITLLGASYSFAHLGRTSSGSYQAGYRYSTHSADVTVDTTTNFGQEVNEVLPTRIDRIGWEIETEEGEVKVVFPNDYSSSSVIHCEINRYSGETVVFEYEKEKRQGVRNSAVQMNTFDFGVSVFDRQNNHLPNTKATIQGIEITDVLPSRIDRKSLRRIINSVIGDMSQGNLRNILDYIKEG